MQAPRLSITVLFGLMSYIMACPLTDLISLDVTQTHWENVMTYAIMVLALPLWFIIAIGCLALYLFIFDR